MIYAGGHSLETWGTWLRCRGCERDFVDIGKAIKELCEVERTAAHYPQDES